MVKFDDATIAQKLEELTKRGISDALVYFCAEEDCPKKTLVDGKIEITIISRSDLVFEGINLQSYCSYLIKAFEEDKVLGSDFSLNQLFVEPFVTLEGNDNALAFGKILSDWAGSNSKHHLSLVGEFGQGKSSAILSYCAAWARDWSSGKAPDRRVPLLIPLRGRDPSSLPRADFLAAWGDKYRLSGKALLNLVYAGKAILIFEGFDEVNNAGLKVERFRQFDALWRYGTKNSKIIFTGRPNFFIDDMELRRLLRIDPLAEAAGGMATRIVQLSFFQEEQVVKALRAFPADHTTAIVELFQRDGQFREVASRPSMLPLIALIWPTIHEEILRYGRVTSTSVIQKYIDFEYTRKRAAVELDSATHGFSKEQNYLTIPVRIRDYFMMCLARDMARSNYSNTITTEEFAQSVKRTTPASETHFSDVNPLEGETEYFQRVRTLTLDRGIDEVVERLTSELRTTGLVARDVASGPNSFFFPHKQFYEYYLARFACLAVGQRLAPGRKSSYDYFLGVSRPCSHLTYEPQAILFFTELSADRWYEDVFTCKLSTTTRLSIVFFLAPYFLLDTLTNEYSINSVIGGRFRRLNKALLNKFSNFVLLVSGVSFLTVLTFTFVNFPLIGGLLAASCAISATMLAVLAGARNALIDILFWLYFLALKMPDRHIHQAKKVLGVITYSMVLTGQRSGILFRRAYYGEFVREHYERRGRP